MEPLWSLLTAWSILMLAFTGLWRWAVRHTDAGIVDVGWAYGVGFVALWLMLWSEGELWRRLLIGGLMAAWSLRLGTYLLRRLRQAKEEDGRYQYLRQHWGYRANGHFFWFFQAQAVADLLLAAPLLLLFQIPSASLTGAEIAGLLILLGSVYGEHVADAQLTAWRANPAHRGRTCRAGLWGWSRHPNYFFEWTHWLAYPVMGLPLLGSELALWWPLLLLPQAVMLALLLRATGIPYTELQAIRSRGDDYRRYQQEVSAFIPWPPRPAPAS